MRLIGRIAALFLAGFTLSASAHANCTAADFPIAVDESGAALRVAARESQPALQDRMRRYQAAKGLSDSSYELAALDAISDKKLEDFDAEASALLLKIDGLGRIPAGQKPNCAELDEIRGLSAKLLSVVQAKSAYMLARLDQKIAEAGGKAPAASASAQKEPAQREPAKTAAAAPPPAAKPQTQEATKPAETEKSAATEKTWTAETKANDAYVPPKADTAATPPAAPAAALDEGYSIDEVQAATRGFFGTISTELAGVIEHAFKTSGRPTAYVLGQEGGGAFLAGLRFGQGTLYMRNRSETRKVYWHGPSLGTDFGASGTRTLFLIYNLGGEEALYRTFTGVDGSAFLVGGVGMTVLKGGDVIMAPIRTGLGLRVGASIGYVRFTSEPTWNPF